MALLLAPIVFAQNQTPPAPPPDAAAFNAIVQLLPKTRQGGDSPSEADLKTRREAGMEIAAKAKQFLKDFPASKGADNAQALWNMGLAQAAVSGDAHAAAQLQMRAAEIVKDPKMPDSLKLQGFVMNYLAQRARKNGKHALDDNSPDSQKANMDALFAAADVLSDADELFKMLLLQDRSDKNLSTKDQRSVAQRVLDDPRASAAVKVVAKGILSGEQSYAVGKPLHLSFVAIDGRKIDLADLKGKVVMIDFWATWCGPCVAEMPEVKQVYDKYHAAGFEILGISLDDNKDRLLAFVKENHITWPQYFDGKHWNNEISFRFGINAIPAEWLVDKKGILRDTDSRGNLEQRVNELLHEK